MDQIKIGQFMKEIRTEKGMTQAALAEQLHVSDKTISKWENGKSMPEPALMLPLCEIFHISVSDLLNGKKITPDEYHSKMEETMMDLVKETEKSKKRGYQGLFGIIILCIFIFIAGKLIMPKEHWIGIFVNTIDMVIILFTDLVVLLASGYGKDFINGFHVDRLKKSELIRCRQSLELLQKSTVYTSLFICAYAVISILRLMEDPSMLGPQFSIALLGLLYAFVIYLVLLIPIYRLKTRIEEAS